ncbi:alpha-(1,3)-fucosyltransferase fut-1-like [Watersipora subatra]|uniref:alpha-(1,3)-fucosyltransferase fut-1-like n=1 Tax=Watersipora subatra TaxID=2589382 RepID=UPI00355BABC7
MRIRKAIFLFLTATAGCLMWASRYIQTAQSTHGAEIDNLRSFHKHVHQQVANYRNNTANSLQQQSMFTGQTTHEVDMDYKPPFQKFAPEQITNFKNITKSLRQTSMKANLTSTTMKPTSRSCKVDYMLSGNKTKKIIFYMGDLWEGMGGILRFDGCEYSNCIYQTCDNTDYAPLADTLIFAHNSKHVTLTLSPKVRQSQLWLVYGVESPAYKHYHWNQALNNFNGTLTYLRKSTPESFPYGFTLPIEKDMRVAHETNYAKGKTKGAYAYVSNCNSMFYDRLKVMKELSKYIEVDIYGGCTGKRPCPNRFDAECEAKLHSQYRFYLAFENSLCTEYITEKFYKALQSDGFYVPVALGGLSVQEYELISPPNSFIHVYNFSSIEALGKHLQTLVKNDTAYNSYHEWRNSFRISMLASKERICDLCKVINHPDMLHSNTERMFADEFNDPKNCRNFTIM